MKKVAYLLIGSLLLLATPVLVADSGRTRSSYLRRVQSDVDEMTVHLHELEGKIDSVPAEKRKRFNDSLKALWKKERLARVQLEQLKHAHDERWKKLRQAEDSTLIHLRKAYQYMLNHFLK